MYIVISLGSLTWRKCFELPASLLLRSGTFYWVRIRAACSQALPYTLTHLVTETVMESPAMVTDLAMCLSSDKQKCLSRDRSFVSQAGKSRLVSDVGRLLVLLKNGMWEWRGRENGQIIMITHETACNLNL